MAQGREMLPAGLKRLVENKSRQMDNILAKARAPSRPGLSTSCSTIISEIWSVNVLGQQ